VLNHPSDISGVLQVSLCPVYKYFPWQRGLVHAGGNSALVLVGTIKPCPPYQAAGTVGWARLLVPTGTGQGLPPSCTSFESPEPAILGKPNLLARLLLFGRIGHCALRTARTLKSFEKLRMFAFSIPRSKKKNRAKSPLVSPDQTLAVVGPKAGSIRRAPFSEGS
jgi:hypothetical protein